MGNQKNILENGATRTMTLYELLQLELLKAKSSVLYGFPTELIFS